VYPEDKTETETYTRQCRQDEDGGDVRSETDIEATVIRNGQLKELAKAIDMLDKDEQKVLTLIASGRKKKDCAEELGISPRMLRHREERIYEKLRTYLKKNGWI
jgi:DNA-binding NarL/FixJ family response regulator